jgi:YjbE family integral membrane protein
LGSPDWSLDSAAWSSLLKIIAVNTCLSGDNAVLIALTCRSIPPQHRRAALLFGAGASVALMVILTGFASLLIAQPCLRLAGGAALLWIAVKMLLPEQDDFANPEREQSHLSAVRTVVVAEAFMSLDNVLGVAAVARGRMSLMVVGLAVGIPLIVYGSRLVMKLFARFPLLITLGSAYLGYLGGELAAGDPFVEPWIREHAPALAVLAPLGAALAAVTAGKVLGSGQGREGP